MTKIYIKVGITVSHQTIVILITVTLLICILLNILLMILKNKSSARKKEIMDIAIKSLYKGMSRNEVYQLFKGFKPSKDKKNKITYKFERKGVRSNKGKILELIFDKNGYSLIDIILYDTVTKYK